ncbi:phosphate acetyltransferase [Desulfomicrobium orale]|uniref:Phosphate acetyltransferase n=1 Tax=Desulfomicrobium orale DSM 12838 TaxID=888061 RepID=A0A120KNA7_9BACT|nr:phosphate acetyltransferase [Desulfomicrobium orale]AMD93589.1 phosphate acetyltransferase [Desulfomicrobium orale DSM 12838]
MSKNLYITATESRSGKSAIVLGVMQMLLRDIRRVGFFRPIISDDSDRKDHDIDLVLSQFYLGLRYEETYALTMKQAKDLVNAGQQALLIERIINKYKELEERCDFVLLEGTDFQGSSHTFEFDINADIAANLGSPLLIVINGNQKTEAELVSSTKLAVESFTEKSTDILGIVINRTALPDREALRRTLQESLERPELLLYTIPEVAILGKPTVADVMKWIGAEVLYGKEGLGAQVNDIVVAAMQIENFLNYIEQGSLVVTPGDRQDIIVSSLASRQSSSYPDIAGILLTGGIAPSKTLSRLVDGWTGMPVPVLLGREATFQTARRLYNMYGKIEPGDQKKIATALGIFEENVNTEELRGRLNARKSSKVTPQMFEYALIEKAKKHRQHIVLPEGNDERILRAADILLRRGVADLTILGDAKTISSMTSQMGLNLAGANIVSPAASPNYEDYVSTFLEMRKKKGMSRELAQDSMVDPTYFGTMMVYKGQADGMVSGAVNTTAHTIRPAFQIIKTRPGASIVSSVFLMCLKDRVLVFGDCAVNPNPTAVQLAEIAISSAETARIFGVEPRVAMLSYSTGDSGAGGDVDLVVEATRLAREQAPGLKLEGPLQYDAAIDPEVASKKLPDSEVAGRATVFVFPDLNTGNNTYKAVQRAANAVAIGPVLQGLNKPVNDLSRGCTVPDIVNTVAITAIQAQAEKGLI